MIWIWIQNPVEKMLKPQVYRYESDDNKSEFNRPRSDSDMDDLDDWLIIRWPLAWFVDDLITFWDFLY